MSDIGVFIDGDDGSRTQVGTLHIRVARGAERVGFEYTDAWLNSRDRFALEPGLPLRPGPLYPPKGKGLFNAFSDAAPDRWGRYLVARREKHHAQAQQRTPRDLFHSDYLLGIHDSVRMGALRFARLDANGDRGPFLAEDQQAIPPMIELRRLQSAAMRVDAHQETDDDLELVFAPGSSLGGARPKAVVVDPDGKEFVAKFERDQDSYPVIAWEATALALAQAAGVDVPDFRVERVDSRSILLMERFDREPGKGRVPFMSALTLTESDDGDQASYLDIAEGLIQNGASPDHDLAELWRRMVFNVLASNTDDHLRNHGVLRSHHGWILSPAYDMNPTPSDQGPRVLKLALDDKEDRSANLDLALSVADAFGLDESEANAIAGDVAHAVSQWREVATRFDISRSQLSYMESAFEHRDLEKGLELGARENGPTPSP